MSRNNARRGGPPPDVNGWHEIRDVLRDARETHGLGYTDLARLMLEPRPNARRLNARRQAVWHLENRPGHKGPWASTIEDYCTALNISVTFDGVTARWRWGHE